MWIRYFSLWCKKNTLNYYTESYWKICGVPTGPLESFPSLTLLATALQSTRVFVLRGERRCAWFSWWMIVSLFSPPVCSVCALRSLMSSCRRLSIRPAHWLGIVCCDLCLMNERKWMPACQACGRVCVSVWDTLLHLLWPQEMQHDTDRVFWETVHDNAAAQQCKSQ